MNGIKLRGTGRCVPANTVTNDDLSRLVDTNDEWRCHPACEYYVFMLRRIII